MAVKKIRAAITPPAMAVRFLKNASHIRRPCEISFCIDYFQLYLMRGSTSPYANSVIRLQTTTSNA